MADRVDLYKAVKYQVESGYEDHGYNLAEMWAMVHRTDNNGRFWRKICLRDYESYIIEKTVLTDEVKKFKAYFRGRNYYDADDLRLELAKKLRYELSWVETSYIVHAIDWEHHFKIVIEKVTPQAYRVTRVLAVA